MMNATASHRPASVPAPPADATATAVLATNVKLSPRAFAKLRAAAIELAAAIDAMNHAQAARDRAEDDDEFRAREDHLWGPAHRRRERAGEVFAFAARRCGVGVVVLGGHLFAQFGADASECEEPIQACTALKLDRVVVLG
jgi:hypothetical protein